MEGITMGIRKSAVLLKKTSKEKEVKYKIKTRHGNIPVYEEKDKPKRKVGFSFLHEGVFSIISYEIVTCTCVSRHLHPDIFCFSQFLWPRFGWFETKQTTISS